VLALWILGIQVIRFSGFKTKKLNLIEPNRFGLNFKKFELLGSVGFCGSNRTEPNHEQA
jgi:hypothetical protein